MEEPSATAPVASPQEEETDDSILAAAQEEIYQQLIESVCIQLACGIHRSVKTGVISWKEILLTRHRHELFPTLYSAQDEDDGVVKQTLQKYATEMIEPTNPYRQLEHRNNNFSNKKDVVTTEYPFSLGTAATAVDGNVRMIMEAPSTITTPAAVTYAFAMSTPVHSESQSTEPPQPPPTPTMQTRSAIHQMDIWGKCPPKEPKQLVTCSICGRQVSTSRFAPHLDKCMGVGTSTRAAAAAAAAVASSSVVVHHHPTNTLITTNTNNHISSNNNNNNSINTSTASSSVTGLV